MHPATMRYKTIEDDDYDDFSDTLELAELAASAHSLQHSPSPLELANFLIKLDHTHLSDDRQHRDVEEIADDILSTLTL